MGELMALITAVILILVGAAGIFLPLLPGVPLAWLGFLIYALATRFSTIPLWEVLVFLGATLVTVAFDFAAPIVGARRWNASRYGVIGGTAGLLLGIFMLGPLGIVIGPILGAFLGELLSGKSMNGAAKSAFGAFIGFLAGTVLKFAVIAGMAGFLIASFFK